LTQSLQPKFIGIHLRAEQDVYENDADFNKDLPLIIERIKYDRCLFAYFDNSSIPTHNLPQIYIASGLFTTNHTYNGKETESSTYRQEAVIKAFHAAGLRNVVTRLSLHKYAKKHLMYAEQHAYLDLLVLKASSCFIPAAPFG
jgi:hypothetical protein